jgi:RNA polymerase sigma-70 factor (ECF subfamily)
MWPEPQQTTELLGEAKAGNSEAVNRLLERHRQAIHRLVQLRLDQKIQGRVDASDVVQDVMFEASRRLRDYLQKPDMPFHLWLRHIAQDRIIDAHRRHRASAKRSVDRERPAVIVPTMDHSTVELMAQICDPEQTPASAAAQQEMIRRVEAALGQLDDQDGEIIMMRHYEHLTNQESAIALELSEPAAGMRYLRAIRRLRELLLKGEKDQRDKKDK